MQASSDNAQSIIKNAVNEVNMHTTIPNWCTVLSYGKDQAKSRAAQCHGTYTPSRYRKLPQQHDSGLEFFAQSLEMVTKSKQPVQLQAKVHWDWTGWQYVAIVVRIDVTFGLFVVKIKGRYHHFHIAELQPRSLEIS